MKCDYYPGRCYSNKPASKKVTVRYNCVEQDVLCLCNECADKVMSNALKHGYIVTHGLIL